MVDETDTGCRCQVPTLGAEGTWMLSRVIDHADARRYREVAHRPCRSNWKRYKRIRGCDMRIGGGLVAGPSRVGRTPASRTILRAVSSVRRDISRPQIGKCLLVEDLMRFDVIRIKSLCHRFLYDDNLQGRHSLQIACPAAVIALAFPRLDGEASKLLRGVGRPAFPRGFSVSDVVPLWLAVTWHHRHPLLSLVEHRSRCPLHIYTMSLCTSGTCVASVSHGYEGINAYRLAPTCHCAEEVWTT